MSPGERNCVEASHSSRRCGASAGAHVVRFRPPSPAHILPFISPPLPFHTSRIAHTRYRPPFATASSTWRSPRHIAPRHWPVPARVPWSASWAALALLALRASAARVRAARKRAFLLRLVAAGVVACGVGGAVVGYGAFNRAVGTAVATVSSDAIGREVRIGRLRRVSLPLRAHFGESVVEGEYGPQVRVREVVVGVARLGKGEVEVDVEMRGVKAVVGQVVKVGRFGRVAEWDVWAGLQERAVQVAPEWDGVVDEEERATASAAWRSWLVPGRLTVKDSALVFVPADLFPGEYGHGAEEVRLGGVNAEVKFLGGGGGKSLRSGALQFEATAVPEGGSEGASIALSAQSDVRSLLQVQAGEKLVDLKVKAAGVPARQVASFLNLPFRADEGMCDCRLDVRFFHDADELVPEIHGSASTDGVALRFHPDPTTPEFRNVGGTIRFVDRMMFLEGPGGDLGSLPMTVNGSIDLSGEGAFDLVANIRSTDVNNVINTFDMDKFAPVSGEIKGEVRITGPLEEPFLEGSAMSSGPTTFDKLQLEEAKLQFQWETAPGVLQFTTMSARIAGGGDVSGRGGMYFDMTKVTPYEAGRPAHHPRNPKALVGRRAKLLPAPKDEMDIDLDAPARPYDSMLFEFEVENADGGKLVEWYGGPNGGVASAAVGLISGDAVVAGHAKDANLRALWRSVSAPPSVYFASSPNTSPSMSASIPSGEVQENSGDGEARDVYVRTPIGMFAELMQELDASRTGFKSNVKSKMKPSSASFPGRESLGGGEFRGAVFMKMGDLPAARRVKVRTTITDLDLRRLLWHDPSRKEVLANSPAMMFSADSYYKGVMRQRLLPMDEASGGNPRTPEAELLGVDGALAVRGLRLNNFAFSESLTGSCQASGRAINFLLQERRGSSSRSGGEAGADFRGMAPPGEKTDDPVIGPEDLAKESSAIFPLEGKKRRLFDGSLTKAWPSLRAPKNNESAGIVKEGGKLAEIPTALPQPVIPPFDEVHVHASEDGTAFFSLRRDSSSVVMSLGKVAAPKRSLSLLVRNLKVDEILGGNGTGMDGIPSATVGLDWALNLSKRHGTGNFSIRRLSFGGLALERFSGDLRWRGSEVLLRNAVARLRHSEYELVGSYTSPTRNLSEGPSWELNGSFPNADISELLELLQSRQGFVQEADTASDEKSSWSMPNLPFEQQLSWFQSYIEAEKERLKRAKIIGNEAQAAAKEMLSDQRPSIFDVRGKVKGSFSIGYNPKRWSQAFREETSTPGPKTVLRSMASTMKKVSFDFDLQGKNWKLDGHSLGSFSASGKYNGSDLEVVSTLEGGQNGFLACIDGVMDNAGRLNGFAYVKDVSTSALSPYLQGKSNLTGNLSARVDIDGYIDDPRVEGRALWSDGASLNGRNVRDARGDIQCRNGRCSLDLNGRFGGRRRSSQQQDQSFDVLRSLFDGELSATTDDLKSPDDIYVPSRQRGEPLNLSISAPSRKYVLEHIRKSMSASLWSDLESFLHSGLEVGGDDIEVDINVRKFGFLLLSPVLTNLGWIDGSSDIDLSIRGTLADPVIAGRCSVMDGELWPSLLTRPIEGLRGELVFEKSGAVTTRSIFGRSNGRPIMISGSLPLSEKQLAITERNAAVDVSKETFPDRVERRAQSEKRLAAVSLLARYRRGMTADIADVLVDLGDQFYGNVSGRVNVKETLMTPSLSGSASFSKGCIYLASPPISPESALASMPSMFRQLRSDGRKQAETEKTDEGQIGSSTAQEPSNPDGIESGQRRQEYGKRGADLPKPGSTGGTVKLDNFSIILGKDMRIVYPYLLNFVTTGEVTADGSSASPELAGTLFFTQGELNLLTTKMDIKRDEESYVRFEKGEDVTDPTVTLVLEDKSLQLQVKDAKASQCLKRLKISDIRGNDLDESVWIEMVRNRLDEVQSALSTGKGIPSLAVKYLVNWCSLKGKLGPSNWRFYPALVSSMGEFSSEQSLEDLGVGVDADVGKFTFTARKAVRGASAGKIIFKQGSRLKVALESDGPLVSSSVELRLSGRSRIPKQQLSEIPPIIIDSNSEEALSPAIPDTPVAIELEKGEAVSEVPGTTEDRSFQQRDSKRE